MPTRERWAELLSVMEDKPPSLGTRRPPAHRSGGPETAGGPCCDTAACKHITFTHSRALSQLTSTEATDHSGLLTLK